MYRPTPPGVGRDMSLAIRAADPDGFSTRLRALTNEVDPTIRLTKIEPLTNVGGGEAHGGRIGEPREHGAFGEPGRVRRGPRSGGGQERQQAGDHGKQGAHAHRFDRNEAVRTQRLPAHLYSDPRCGSERTLPKALSTALDLGFGCRRT